MKFSVAFVSMIPSVALVLTTKSGLSKAGSDYKSSFVSPHSSCSLSNIQYYNCSLHESLCSLGFLDIKNYLGLPLSLQTTSDSNDVPLLSSLTPIWGFSKDFLGLLILFPLLPSMLLASISSTLAATLICKSSAYFSPC